MNSDAMRAFVFSKMVFAAPFVLLTGGDKRVIESGVIIYDDFNRRVKSDQSCIGTVMPNFGNDALGNGTKLIETTEPAVRVRKLTQKECWRLMGFEDEDFYKAQVAMNENLYGGNDRSGSQLYKQAGNSIVVDVLCAILEELYQAMPYLFENMEIGSFFSGIGAFEKALTTFDTRRRQCDDNQPPKNDELRQVGYINNYNGDANRVYDGDTVARVLKAEAGGGGAKTGWYTVGAGKVRSDDIEHRAEKPPGEAPQEKPQDYDS